MTYLKEYHDINSFMSVVQMVGHFMLVFGPIIVISSDMEEILGMADRLIILYEGKMTGKLEKKDFEQTTVLRYASGEID